MRMSQGASHFEVEQKFRVDDLSPVRQRLNALGATLEAPIEQVDTYFSHPARDFAVTDEALRLRRVGERNCITYKGPKIDSETKTRRELELPLPDGQLACEQFGELLLLLGFGRVAAVHKRREVARLAWQGRAVEIALDTVEHIGQFAELETSATEAELVPAKAAIASLANELGLQHNERRSYLELLLAPSP